MGNSDYRLKSLLPAKNIHISWLIAAASAGVIVGAVAVRFVDSRLGIEGIVMALYFLVIALRHRAIVGVGLFCLVGLLIGFYRESSVLQSLGVYDLTKGLRRGQGTKP